jgi:hypothetical protein
MGPTRKRPDAAFLEAGNVGENRPPGPTHEISRLKAALDYAREGDTLVV